MRVAPAWLLRRSCEIRKRARRRLAAALRASSRGRLACRRGRGGRARSRPARCVRRAATLGGLRARRNPRRARDRAPALGLPAFRGRRLDLTGATTRRVRPDYVCDRRWGRGPHRSGGLARAACGARCGHCLAAGVSRRLRARAARGRPRGRDLDRRGRSRGRDPRRARARAQDRGTDLDRHRCGCAFLHPGCGARVRQLVGRGFDRSARLDARSPACSAHKGARARRRLLRSRDQLPDRGLRPRLCRSRAARPRGRHAFEPPVQTPPCRQPLLRHRRPLATGSLSCRLARHRRAPLPHPSPVAARLRGRALRALPSQRMKVLLVTMYFPPSGGGGVQRPLKFATHLPAHGIETHVLAPDDAKWIHSDPELVPPTQAWIHRARYLGPRSRKLADELHGRQGLDRLSRQARSLSRRVLVPDENVGWNLTAIPAAVRIARAEGIDVVLTTSPPNSVHLVGAAVKRITGARWVADLRDSVGAHPHRRVERASVRAKEKVSESVARLVARQADVIVAASEAIAQEARALEPAGVVTTILNGADFDDFAGLEYARADRFRITHTGSFFGKRDPRPFLTALSESGLEDVVARFVGDFRVADREWAEALGLGNRLELHPYVPRRQSLALQRDSEALLLLIPEAGGRGQGVLSGKVFEYLAAERPILAAVPPDGAAAVLIRETGAGIVAAPDDVGALRAALEDLHGRWVVGQLDGTPLSADDRERLSRAARVEELAEVLRGLE